MSNTLDEPGVERRVMLVNSMGGFAAMSSGWRLGVDHVLAFAPQTSVSLKHKIAWRDFRWWKQIGCIYHQNGLSSDAYDLVRVAELIKGCCEKILLPKMEIFVGATSGLDVKHDEYLSKLPSVEAHYINGYGHNAVKALLTLASIICYSRADS